MAFFCVFAGSGEVDLFELLSLEEEEAGSIVVGGALRCARIKITDCESDRLSGSRGKVEERVGRAMDNRSQAK